MASTPDSRKAGLALDSRPCALGALFAEQQKPKCFENTLTVLPAVVYTMSNIYQYCSAEDNALANILTLSRAHVDVPIAINKLFE